MNVTPHPLTKFFESEKRFFCGAEIKDFGSVENRTLEGFHFEQTDFINGRFDNTSFSAFFLRTVCFSNIEFLQSAFVKTEASHYFFEKVEFKSLAFSECDFSGGSYQDVLFKEVEFHNSDFALCEFKNVRFINCRFINASFNASVFENVDFEEPSFKSSTFHAVEGLDPAQISFLKEKGGDISLPVEVDLIRGIKLLFAKMNKVVLALIFVSAGFVLGLYSRNIPVEFKKLITMDANPLSVPLSMLYENTNRYSYFFYHPQLLNFDFSDRLSHWSFLGEASMQRETLRISYEDFVSFPASLVASGFKGALFYTDKNSVDLKPLKNFLEDSTEIWLPLGKDINSLQLSFYYKKGHPSFSLFGRYKEGGFTVLAEILSRTLPDSDWVYYSETIPVSSDLKSVCLKLHDFPDTTLLLDDVNLETAI